MRGGSATVAVGWVGVAARLVIADVSATAGEIAIVGQRHLRLKLKAATVRLPTEIPSAMEEAMSVSFPLVSGGRCVAVVAS